VLGRLAWVQYYGGNCTSLGPPRTGCDKIQESYKYDVVGSMLGKRVTIIRGAAFGSRTASWTYDNEGVWCGLPTLRARHTTTPTIPWGGYGLDYADQRYEQSGVEIDLPPAIRTLTVR